MFSKVFEYTLFLTIYLYHSDANVATYWSQYSTFDDKRLSENITLLKRPSVVSCAVECATSLPCMSYSYHTGNATCLLYSIPLTNRTDVISEQGWISYNLMSDDCPTALGYYYNRNLNMCYSLETGYDRNITDAMAFCLSQGHLIRVNSYAKYAHLLEFLQSRTARSVYIGGYSENEDNVFLYEDGTPLTFFYWHDDNPIGEPAIVMRKRYGYAWMNSEGYDLRPFLCEITL